MHIAIADAETKLADLVARAATGEEVVITRGNEPPVRLVPDRRKPTQEEKLAAFTDLENAGARTEFGADAAHCADFLYDDDGLPA